MTYLTEVRRAYRERFLRSVKVGMLLLADAEAAEAARQRREAAAEARQRTAAAPTVGAAGALYGPLPPMEQREYYGCGSVEHILALRQRIGFPDREPVRADIRWTVAQGTPYIARMAALRLARLARQLRTQRRQQ